MKKMFPLIKKQSSDREMKTMYELENDAIIMYERNISPFIQNAGNTKYLSLCKLNSAGEEKYPQWKGERFLPDQVFNFIFDMGFNPLDLHPNKNILKY